MSSLSLAYQRGAARAPSLAPGSLQHRYLADAARCLAKLLGWPKSKLLSEVRRFHTERLDAVPDFTRYPELRGYRKIVLEEERGMVENGVSPDTIVLAATLNFWRDTRLLQETGRAWRADILPERCRVLYAPETDGGPLHAKNVDNPLTYWKPRPPYPKGSRWPHSHPLYFDTVGSGLLIDEIPPEIFPVDVIELCKQHCTTVEAATEFLVRYNFFWSSRNLLVHDTQGNSMAFDKTRCRIVPRKPNAQGISFINGMGAMDPAMRAFQKAQREKALQQRGVGWDSCDGAYWTNCEMRWDNMIRYVAELSRKPTLAGVKELMERRESSGPMCLTGEKCHPDQVAPGCTLVMDIWFLGPRRLHRRQWRGSTPAYLDTPEIVDFTS